MLVLLIQNRKKEWDHFLLEDIPELDTSGRNIFEYTLVIFDSV